jgi:hypothetical protein
MMLVIVLCRFSVPIGKYFFKINYSHSHRYLYRKWLNPLHQFVAALPASGWCNLLNLEYRTAIVSGVGTKTAVKSWHKSVSVIKAAFKDRAGLLSPLLLYIGLTRYLMKTCPIFICQVNKSKLVKIETKTASGFFLHSFKPPSMLVS